MRRLTQTTIVAVITCVAAQALAAAPARKPMTLDQRVTAALKSARSAKTRATHALAQVTGNAVAGDPGLPGDPGPPGSPGSDGAPGATGAPGASYVTGAIPSKATITGVWGGRSHRPTRDNGDNNLLEVVFPVGFARPAPATLGDENVGFAAGTPGVAAAEQLPTKCTGTIDQPTAAPGYVCLYLNEETPINLNGSVNLSGKALDTTLSDADRYGFTVHVTVKDPGDAPATVFRAEGTWAYTAP